MDLSNVALTKIGTDGRLYKLLKTARPDTRFTLADEIMVSFEMPEMEIPSGPDYKEKGRANGERIREASAKAKHALEAIEGLTINNFFGGIGSALVSGSAQAIAAMLELPEVTKAASTKGIVVRPADGHAR
jgi:hypothetical protein